MLDCLVVHSQSLCQLIRIAGTILENFDYFGSVGSASSATQQIPEQPSEIFVLIRRAGLSVSDIRDQNGGSAQDFRHFERQLWDSYHRYDSRGFAGNL